MSRSHAYLLVLLSSIAATTAACGDGSAETPQGPAATSSSGGNASGPGATPTATPTNNTPSTSQPDGGAQDGAAATDGVKVLKLSPAPGEQGVKDDTTIVIVFDRAMDTASVQAAYSSTALPADKVSFVWNDEGDTLTLVPTAKLSYAAGDALVAALAYDVRIAKTARAKSGLGLSTDVELSFSTLRRITLKAAKVQGLTGTVNGNAAVDNATLLVGDNAANVRYKALVTFSLDSLPSDVVIEKATVSSTQTGVVGSPDVDLGALSAQHVSFGALDAVAYAVPVLGTSSVTLGLGFNGNPPLRSTTVTDMVADDLENRNIRKDRSQFRLEYAKASDNDGVSDGFNLSVADAKLEIVYLGK